MLDITPLKNKECVIHTNEGDKIRGYIVGYEHISRHLYVFILKCNPHGCVIVNSRHVKAITET
jgi:hypothetical protein